MPIKSHGNKRSFFSKLYENHTVFTRKVLWQTYIQHMICIYSFFINRFVCLKLIFFIVDLNMGKTYAAILPLHDFVSYREINILFFSCIYTVIIWMLFLYTFFQKKIFSLFLYIEVDLLTLPAMAVTFKWNKKHVYINKAVKCFHTKFENSYPIIFPPFTEFHSI